MGGRASTPGAALPQLLSCAFAPPPASKFRVPQGTLSFTPAPKAAAAGAGARPSQAPQPAAAAAAAAAAKTPAARAGGPAGGTGAQGKGTLFQYMPKMAPADRGGTGL
jgi:hypothetical protein